MVFGWRWDSFARAVRSGRWPSKMMRVVEGVDEGAKGLGVVAVIGEGVQNKVEAVEF